MVDKGRSFGEQKFMNMFDSQKTKVMTEQEKTLEATREKSARLKALRLQRDAEQAKDATADKAAAKGAKPRGAK